MVDGADSATLNGTVLDIIKPAGQVHHVVLDLQFARSPRFYSYKTFTLTPRRHHSESASITAHECKNLNP